MKINNILVIFVSILLLCGCTQCSDSSINKSRNGNGGIEIQMDYAELLQMKEVGKGRILCRILDPWRSERVMMQYLLVPDDDKDWDEKEEDSYSTKYGESTLLRTPLKRMTITASCHAWLLSQLEALDNIAIMCDTVFVNARNIKEWMRGTKSNGEPQILDAGTTSKPNIEVLVAGNSDAIWISPYENSTLGNLDKLSVPVIYCAEYMETTPLARAEWMKFYGRLVGRAEKSDSLFNAISNRYEKLSNNSENGKKILVDLPYGATWYVPGGCSTSARLYEDAGFTYPWATDMHSGSLSLSKEAVLSKAQDCDIWCIRYMDSQKDMTMEDFKNQNVFFEQFKAAQEDNVWGCNTSYSDFFDVTPFRPDSLLNSFIKMDGAFYKKILSSED